MAKKGLGINIDNEFEPIYEIPEDKRKVVDELARLSRSAKTVWLASDEDREGEAIAWHLAKVLDLPIDNTKRIVFHEITQRAILSAIENPRTIDLNLGGLRAISYSLEEGASSALSRSCAECRSASYR